MKRSKTALVMTTGDFGSFGIGLVLLIPARARGALPFDTGGPIA